MKRHRGFGFKLGNDRRPRVVVGSGSKVEGRLRFEREVRLFVHESATIGEVEGAQPQRYSGDELPG